MLGLVKKKDKHKMKILIQIGHPAQFHFYKNAINQWITNGHSVKLLIKNKDILEALVEKSGFDYVNFERKVYKKSSKIDLLRMVASRSYAFLCQLLQYCPDIVISPDPILARICRVFKAKFIAVSEDDYAVIKNLADLLFPVSDAILAPQVCDFSLWQSKKIDYEGYMKLAYLHPNQFTPNKTLVYKHISNSKPYIIIRLVSLMAHHDKAINGIDNDLLDKIIEKIKSRGYNIYISSEKSLPPKYRQFASGFPIEHIHHLMNYASLLICDSQSMAVESAMLGVPSLRFNDFAGRIGVLEELEHKYGLTYGITTNYPQKLFEKVEELLAMPNLKEEFQRRRQAMLADKIDVTAFLVWFIENYPESAKIMKENPDYQFKFR